MSESAVTAKECLEGIVERIQARIDKFAGVNWVLGYDFSASNDGIWHIVIDDGLVEGPLEGEHEGATITTVAPLETFLEQQKHKFNPMTAMWNTGKVRFHGDAMAAHRFNLLLNS